MVFLAHSDPIRCSYRDTHSNPMSHRPGAACAVVIQILLRASPRAAVQVLIEPKARPAPRKGPSRAGPSSRPSSSSSQRSLRKLCRASADRPSQNWSAGLEMPLRLVANEGVSAMFCQLKSDKPTTSRSSCRANGDLQDAAAGRGSSANIVPVRAFTTGASENCSTRTAPTRHWSVTTAQRCARLVRRAGSARGSRSRRHTRGPGRR